MDISCGYFSWKFLLDISLGYFIKSLRGYKYGHRIQLYLLTLWYNTRLFLFCDVSRYIRREKEIAETRRELAEVDNMRHKQQLESTQRQLTSAQSELKQLCENVTSQRVTALQHAEVMKKVAILPLPHSVIDFPSY